MKASVNPLKATELYDVLYYAPVGVLIENCDGLVTWINHTLQWQLGVDADEVLGMHSKDLPLEPLLGARGKRVFQSLRAEGEEPNAQLKCIEDVLPEYSETGIRVRYFLETTPSAQHPPFKNDLLRLLVSRPVIDRITGLQDRDAIVSTLRTEVSRSRRYANPLSIVVLRVRGMEQFGTVVDHPSRTMSAASALLKDSTRWADSVGRFDDWEFLLVLPETTAVAALKLTQKIASRIDEHNLLADSAALSVQFGVVEWGRGDDESMLLRRAQLALNRSVAL